MLLVLCNLLLLLSTLVWSVAGQPGNDFTQRKEELKRKIINDLGRTLENVHGIRMNTFDELNKCLDDLSTGLQERENLINDAKLKVDKIWLTNQPQTVKAKVFVDGIVKVERLVPKRVIITRPKISVDKIGDLGVLEKRFNRASKSVSKIVNLVENQVVRKDRANQVINGTIHFLGPIRADLIKIESLRPSTLINGISLHELRTNVLRKLGNQTVTGHWKFNNNIYADKLRVNGLLSGINMSNILLVNSPQEQVVTGHLKIKRANFNTLNYETINGIRKDELVLKSRSSSRITGVKRFTRVQSAANIRLTGNLNGKNWTHLIRNSVNIYSTQSIPNTLRFVTIPTINNLTARSVNNIRIDNLKAGLTPEELVKLSGHKTFRSLSASRVTLNGRLNGLSIPNDLVTLRSLQNLSQPITFEGRVSFTSNLTIGTINDVNIVRDTVYRHSLKPQIIHGTKIFDRSVSVKNLRSKETKFRHINLDTLDPMALDGSQFARRSNVIYEDKLTINGNLNVKRINGIPINELIESLFSKTRDQSISWPTQFTGSLIIGSVITKTINGISVPKDLVRINTNVEQQVITGRKIFNSITLGKENELIMKGNILNGVNLNSVEKSVIKNDPLMRKDCYGKKSFSSVKVLGNIVAERVNGLILERDVLLVDRPQNITGKLAFNSDVQAYQVSFPGGLQVETINGIPVDKTLDDLVLHDSQSVTLENKDFRGGLVADSIDLKGTINGVNLVKLISSVVSLDSPQAIYSPLKFVDEIVFDQPIDTRSVNGADLQRTFFDFLKTSSSSPDGIKIVGNVKINGNLITSRLNGQPPEVVKQVILHPKTDNRFDRPVIFNSTVYIDHLTISNTATLDGISPLDLMPLDKAVQLDQPMRIRGNVHIDHQLIVRSGKINNCSLNDITLFSGYRNTSNAVHFQRPINFNSVNILGNLRLINSTINSFDIEKLSKQIQLVTPEHQKFNSSFTFADDVHVDELFIEGTINGVNLREVYADSVRQSADHQKITGHKTFKSLRIENGDVTFNGPVNLRGTINGINVTKLYDNLIKPGTYNVIHGVKIFTSNQPIVLYDIETNSMSDVNFSDLVLTSSTETIPGDTSFTKPIKMNNLETRHHHGRQLINRQSLIKFMDPVNVQQLSVKRINGIPIENFVSSLRDTQLNGSYTINRLYIHGDLLMEPNSKINGVDLSDLNNRSVDVRSTQFIPGSLILVGEANFPQGIDLANDSINGPGASARLEKSLGNATNLLEMDLRQLEDELKDQTLVLARAMSSIDVNKMEFEYFDIFDYFNDFEIATNHIIKISISKDYRPVINSSISANYNQGLTKSIYLEYVYQRNKCDWVTSTFDIQSINNQPMLQDRLINAVGKFFPLTTFQLEGNNRTISVSGWTNLPDCNISLTGPNRFTSNVTFSYLSNNDSPIIISSYQLDAFSDIKYFLDGDQIILITLRSIKTGLSSKINVYQCNPADQPGQGCNLTSPQLKHYNAMSMEIINQQNLRSKLLAIMSVPSDCSQDSTIYIYKWIQSDKKFSPPETLSTPNPLTMKFIDIPQRNVIKLIVANNLQTGICAHNKVKSSSMVDIFLIEEKKSDTLTITKSQKSLDLNINSISFFMVGQEAYLAMASKSAEETFIYHYNPINKKFESKDYQTYITKGVEDVQCFWVSPNQLFMVTTTTDHHKAIIYNAIFI